MTRRSLAFDSFLDFSSAINAETKKKLFAISDTHPVLKNHPLVKRLLDNNKVLISLSAITLINEAILEHSVALAKQASTGDEKACLKALMEQNVLTAASVALNSIMTEQFQNSVHRLSIIVDTANKKGAMNNG